MAVEGRRFERQLRLVRVAGDNGVGRARRVELRLAEKRKERNNWARPVEVVFTM